MASQKDIIAILEKLNLPLDIREFPQSTKTSKEAAEAIGCEVEQIGKSIVFKGKNTGKAYLVVASGKNRINEKKLEEIVGEPVEKGTPEFVREKTGFEIGGVPPFGHREKLRTFVDEDLLAFQEIWCAGGTSHTVFRITPQDLLRATGGVIISVK